MGKSAQSARRGAARDVAHPPSAAGSAAAAEDASGKRRDAAEGPSCRAFGRVLLRRGVVAPLDDVQTSPARRLHPGGREKRSYLAPSYESKYWI